MATGLNTALEAALAALGQELEAVHEIPATFRGVFDLRLAQRADGLQRQADALVGMYFDETMDAPELLAATFDLQISELEFKSQEFSRTVHALSDLVTTLRLLYDGFIIDQCIVLLVSSWDTFLQDAFEACLHHWSGAAPRSAQYWRPPRSFQNWLVACEVFRAYLGVDLTANEPDETALIQLVRRRNAIVHRRGRAKAGPPSRPGDSRLPAQRSSGTSEPDVDKGVATVRAMAEHVHRLLTVRALGSDSGTEPLPCDQQDGRI